MDNYYSNNEFDINKFNTVFEENQVNLDKKKDNELDGMKQVIEKEQLHDMSLGKIFVNMKEEIFGILYDIITINFNSFDTFFEIFTKKNRLFHIGLFLIIICIFLYIISYLFFYPKPEQKGINADLYIPNSNNNYSNNKQNTLDIVKSRKNNTLLKKKLINSTKRINMMQNEINNLKTQINDDDYDYELDDQEVDSEIIPKEIKDQIKNQIKQDMLSGKISNK
jgi:hypothetical protein